MVYKKSYSWRSGFTPTVSADVVGGVFEYIEKRDGVVTRESFLDESRLVESPTHKLFEWNDKKAAEKWRLSVSQKTINHLVATVVFEDQETIKAPALVNVSTIKTGKYVNVIDAMENEKDRAIVLNNAIRRLQSFQKEYQKLSELSGVFKAINEVVEKEL